jgi:hypothetical protein
LLTLLTPLYLEYVLLLWKILLISRKLLFILEKERRNIPINEAILILEGKLDKNNAKYTKMIELWENGSGIVVLQLLSDSDHYLALCRENVTIQATGKTLTNINNGSVYGLMKNKWTYPEILNFVDNAALFLIKKMHF